MNVGKFDGPAGAIDACGGDDKDIVKLRANQLKGVIAAAAVDADIGIGDVFDHVIAVAGVDCGVRRIGGKGPHYEGIIAALSIEVEPSNIVINGERVASSASQDGCLVADAVAEPALRGVDGREGVVHRHSVIFIGGTGVALRLKDLADLEVVVAAVALHHRIGQVVVHGHGVAGAGAGVDDQIADGAGIVDPLNIRGRINIGDKAHRTCRIGPHQKAFRSAVRTVDGKGAGGRKRLSRKLDGGRVDDDDVVGAAARQSADRGSAAVAVDHSLAVQEAGEIRGEGDGVRGGVHARDGPRCHHWLQVLCAVWAGACEGNGLPFQGIGQRGGQLDGLRTAAVALDNNVVEFVVVESADRRVRA